MNPIVAALLQRQGGQQGGMPMQGQPGMGGGMPMGMPGQMPMGGMPQRQMGAPVTIVPRTGTAEEPPPPPPFQPPPNSTFMGYLPGMSKVMKGKSAAGLDLTTQPGMAGLYVPNSYHDS